MYQHWLNILCWSFANWDDVVLPPSWQFTSTTSSKHYLTSRSSGPGQCTFLSDDIVCSPKSMIISKWDGIRLTEQRICLTTAEQLASEMFIDLNVVLRVVSSWALQHPFAAYSGAVQNVRFALAGPGGSASFIPRGIFISKHHHKDNPQSSLLKDYEIHFHKCHLLKLLYMIDKGRESLLLWGAYRKHVIVYKEIKFQRDQ